MFTDMPAVCGNARSVAIADDPRSYQLFLLCMSFLLCFACRLCFTCVLFDILVADILLSFIMPPLILLSFCMDCELWCAASGAMVEQTNKVATKTAVVKFLSLILTFPFLMKICGESVTARVH